MKQEAHSLSKKHLQRYVFHFSKVISLIAVFSLQRPFLAVATYFSGIKPMKLKQFLACLLMASLSMAAHAFERPFPQTAKRGTLSMKDYPSIEMDGKERRLSVGAWIKNQNNTIDMPISLRGREFTMNYTENMQGEIDRVWILNPEEAKRPAPSKSQSTQPTMQIH